MRRLDMKENKTSGLLISFCGLDGCGKTTMIEKLKKDLALYKDIVITKEPTDFVRETKIFRTYSKAYGIVVHDYIAMYIDKLIDGTIPYEKMDYRIFRLIWEHKKVMYGNSSDGLIM